MRMVIGEKTGVGFVNLVGHSGVRVGRRQGNVGRDGQGRNSAQPYSLCSWGTFGRILQSVVGISHLLWNVGFQICEERI